MHRGWIKHLVKSKFSFGKVGLILVPLIIISVGVYSFYSMHNEITLPEEIEADLPEANPIPIGIMIVSVIVILLIITPRTSLNIHKWRKNL